MNCRGHEKYNEDKEDGEYKCIAEASNATRRIPLPRIRLRSVAWLKCALRACASIYNDVYQKITLPNDRTSTG